jgi:hypothetical protein
VDLNLEGKTLVVLVRGRPITVPVVLGGCSLQTQGGRLFLTGTTEPCYPNLYNWTDGVRRFIAWDSVEEYMIFDSTAAYHACLVKPAQCARAAEDDYDEDFDEEDTVHSDEVPTAPESPTIEGPLGLNT